MNRKKMDLVKYYRGHTFIRYWKYTQGKEYKKSVILRVIFVPCIFIENIDMFEKQIRVYKYVRVKVRYRPQMHFF